MVFVGVVSWLALILAAVVAGSRWARTTQRVEAGIRRDERDALVMGEADHTSDWDDQ